jgi:hypothetical protein
LYRGQPAVVYYMLDQFDVDMNQVAVEGRTFWCALGMRLRNVRPHGRLYSQLEEEHTLMMNMARRKPFVLSPSDSRMLLRRSRTLVSLNLGIKMRVQGPTVTEAHRVEMTARCPLPAVLVGIVIDYGQWTVDELAASDGALLGDTLASTFVYERHPVEGPAPTVIDLTGDLY